MFRSLLTISLVAALSAWIRYAEGNPREITAEPSPWVRTVDGWEPRSTLLRVHPPAIVDLHPATVASFQLCASLLCLAAFPAQKSDRPAPPTATTSPVSLRRPRRLPRQVREYEPAT
ncbi:MAG: hypothetical protein KDA61_04395 [Planctomycetales bacterium]|nr:hypothetical protein [Planctomycetales bacterium]